MSDVFDRIIKFNSGREPRALKRKFNALSENCHKFFRGTCHLFYEDYPSGSQIDDAPAAWSCGDLHLENFGSYKGDNRLVYFDINDFDEGMLAPCTRDPVRFITSLFLGADDLGFKREESDSLARLYLKIYRETLSSGHARTVESQTARGLVKDFLEILNSRLRSEFLESRTEKKKGKRKIIVDGVKSVNLEDSVHDELNQLFAKLSQNDEERRFFKVRDCAYRLAGTGSLGLERYLVLVEGNGSPDKNYLLDLKEMTPSCMGSKLQQPPWKSEADRVRSIQGRMQGTPPAVLHSVEFHGKSFLLRELQPTQDKMDLGLIKKKVRRFEKIVQTMAEVTAWDQLRSSGRQGSASADDLIAFGSSVSPDVIIEFAREAEERTRKNFSAFCKVAQHSSATPIDSF